MKYPPISSPPAEVEEQRRQQEEQAAKEARSKELAKARYEKRKAEKREFTARKKAGLLTPEELEAEEKRLAHNREWQKEWREKRKAAEPPKPPKKKSIKELMELEKTGAELTPEETERLAEGKQGFDFASVSSRSKTVNVNRLQLHALVYNIFNWFRRLALPKQMSKNLIDTVRLKLLKIAARVVHSGRYIKFKLCSSCPYKEEVFETFRNIWKLAVQLE